MILVLTSCATISCSEVEKEEIVAYFNSEPIYNYEIKAFVELKQELTLLAYDSLGELEMIVPEKNEVTERELLEYIKYNQYMDFKNEYERYINLTKEEKIIDYYISLIRKEEYINEGLDEQAIQEIDNEHRTMILENSNQNSYVNNIVDVIEMVAKNNNMSYEKCVNEVYLDVTLDWYLQSLIPAHFVREHYTGEVFESVEINMFLPNESIGKHEVDFNELWDTTEKYYAYLYDLSTQYHSYLKGRVTDKITFEHD